MNSEGEKGLRGLGRSPSARFVLLVLMSWTLLSAGCGGGSHQTASGDSIPEGPRIVLGIAAPMTGTLNDLGRMMSLGVKMKLREVNAQGGIDGVRVYVETGDDAGNPEVAIKVARKLSSNSEVMAIIGHFNSACGLAGKPIYKKAGVVTISPGSTNPRLCVDNPYGFRTMYRDDFQGQSLARYAEEHLGAKRIAVFHDNDSYGNGLKNAFLTEAKKLDLEVVLIETYDRDMSEFRPQLQRFRARSPDLLVIAGLYIPGSTIVAQAREVGLKLPILGGGGLFSLQFIRDGGDAVEGTYCTTPFLFQLGGIRAKEWKLEFEDLFGVEPDPWAVQAYDAAGILVTAISEAGPDREKIREWITGLDSGEMAYQGLGGPVYFDENGDCLRPIYMAVVKDGEFVPAEEQFPNWFFDP